MHAFHLVAAAALLVTSQAHAAAPVAKSTGCPSAVPCSSIDIKPVTAPAPSLAILVPQGAPKINSVSLGSNKVVDGQMLDVTVAGEGKACNYYLTITNTDSNDEWPLPKISTFPASDHYALNLNDPQYPHAAYKITAKARPNDVRAGLACAGAATSIPFSKVRPKITVDAPQIVDLLTEPGQKMGGTDRYRTDESIKFNVVGSVENIDPKDDSKRCGWTLELVDGNQVAKIIGTNNQFGVWQHSAPLAGIAQGSYTLTVKTTAADDGKAKQPCLGKASKKVDVFAVPGVITGFKAYVYSTHSDTFSEQVGHVELTPQIVGETCLYKVTRYVAGGGTRETVHVHVKGKSDLIAPADAYPNDKTIVDITVSGSGMAPGCEGSSHKTLTVYDDGKPTTY